MRNGRLYALNKKLPSSQTQWLNMIIIIKNMLNKKRGFTLIELLVVIGIISILSSLLITNLNEARKAAKRVRTFESFNQIALAIQLYYDEKGEWPNLKPPYNNEWGWDPWEPG